MTAPRMEREVMFQMAGHANKFLMLVGTAVILIFNPKGTVTSFPSVAKS